MTNSSVKQERQDVFSAYLPAFITLLFTIAAFSVYTATNPDKHLSTYLALLVIAPTPFVIDVRPHVASKPITTAGSTAST